MAKKKPSTCKKVYVFNGRDYSSADAAARACANFMLKSGLVRSVKVGAACAGKRRKRK